MKYMHFNSSCAYAGLANQLLLKGHSTEDEDIVRAIGLPWHIAYDGETCTYCAGAMLQGKPWFDLYLRPRGWEYQELLLQKADALASVQVGDMIGLQLRPGYKHAVILLEKTDEGCRLLNNKHLQSDEPEELSFSAAEFPALLPEMVAIGRLKTAAPEELPAKDVSARSRATWRQYREALLTYIQALHTFEELMQSRNPLFRALLVDALAMMQLAGEDVLVKRLHTLQTQYMNALKQRQSLILAEHLDVTSLETCLNSLCMH